MSTRSMSLAPDIYRYLLEHSVREPPVLERLRAVTADMPGAEMQVSPEQGQFIALLVRLTGARNIIELGTYTGYSSLAMALALPPGGRLVACDVSSEWTAVARRFWQEAGVAERIELKVQPALTTLDELLAQGEGSFDFAFVDADKGNYINYFEKLLRLVRRGGLICADNTLFVASSDIVHSDSAIARALKRFNDHVHHDERVDLAMVPIGEGLTLLRIR